MNPLASACGVVLVLTSFSAAWGQDVFPGNQPLANKDVERLQGTWRAVKGPGSPATDERAKNIKYVIEGHTMTMIDSNPDKKGRLEGRIKLDPASKAFDWGNTKGGWIGIYALDGDNFRFYALPRAAGVVVPRPKTATDKGGHLFVLQREKP
jgi:uncharacterized protein (TIGR03067 family)